MKTDFMQQAIQLAHAFRENKCGGPFGAVVVKDNTIIGRGSNRVTIDNDPSAHAEIVAIRDACKNLKSFQLTDCEIYSSCEPCPMCLSALYWARINKIYFAATRAEAAKAGFDDQMIYDEIPKDIKDRKIPCEHQTHHEANTPFEAWVQFEQKIDY